MIACRLPRLHGGAVLPDIATPHVAFTLRVERRGWPVNGAIAIRPPFPHIVGNDDEGRVVTERLSMVQSKRCAKSTWCRQKEIVLESESGERCKITIDLCAAGASSSNVIVRHVAAYCVVTNRDITPTEGRVAAKMCWFSRLHVLAMQPRVLDKAIWRAMDACPPPLTSTRLTVTFE